MKRVYRSPTARRLSWSLLLAMATSASAVQAQQVYKCKLDGHPVFQASPCPVEPRAEPPAPPVAAASAATPVAAKKKTLAELLRERDGATPSPKLAHEPKGDGANILRTRMGAV